MSKPTIICIDDEKLVLVSLKEQLKSQFANEYAIEIVDNGEEALEIVEELLEEHIDIPVVISDQIMPGMKGDDVLIRIHKLSPTTLKILLTGQADAAAVGNAINHANLYRYISKPWDTEDLLLTVKEATRSYFQSKLIQEQEKRYSELVNNLNVGVYQISGDNEGKFL
jgi:response regulator RpfG family c-di-GMP phosphodiesterase